MICPTCWGNTLRDFNDNDDALLWMSICDNCATIIIHPHLKVLNEEKELWKAIMNEFIKIRQTMEKIITTKEAEKL